ncbi:MULTISPECIES: Rrf2 family transcriptional regulator [unclassified Flavobacterium]|jgi:Rrf2 family protein|uniref:Rrf2 family transcriptional regulator n=1 Tax=unclassified Flavobacterium TaxID=196869 RepID=UPI00057CE2BE|nr:MULTISPECIES: Rrf2 family transcriptional regulator [unclassified Flavobacterium]KIC00260.1 Rrf2 family transcriptional regulator [Flavobacterium sp. KMS]KIC02901.1 Rrf2 family transcriptional regulator [Flavobacterium sp. JRM]OUL63190.1 transcriptional regulator [Flavobacterium sp. AJR]
MISGKFAITTHILTLLSKSPNDYLSSEYIAGSINLNPVLVRKEISNLKKNHIVESKEGKNGGTRLLKPASEISLLDIFKMTFDTVNLGYAKNQPNPDCPVGKKINENLDLLYADINEKINAQLSTITLENFSNQF